MPSTPKVQTLLKAGPFVGLDATTAPYFVAESLFVDMLNVVPNQQYGGFCTARGRAASVQLPGPCRGFARFSRAGLGDGFVYAVDVAGAGALYFSTPGGAPTLLPLPSGATLTAGRQYSFAAAGSWLFITNGLDTPLKVDQALQVTFWGIAKPTTAPTVMASGSTSTMSGTYTYTVTFGNAVQESSQPDVDSASITVNGTGVALTGIPTSTDPQVTQRNVYRIGGTLGEWRLVATINDNTTTTYNDTADDTSLGHVLVVFRDAPPAFTAICAHRDAVWGFGTPTDPSLLYYSNFGEPWGFNEETQTLPCGENTFNDVAVALVSTGSVLCALKSETQYAVFGDRQANFIATRVSDVGCTSLRSAWSGGGLCGWASWQGAYVWDGSSAPQNISDGAFQTSNLHAIWESLSTLDAATCTAFYFDRGVYFSFPSRDRTYGFDLRSRAWFVLGWSCDQVIYRPEAPAGARVLATNIRAVGEIDAWFASTLDLGGVIPAYIETGTTDGGAPAVDKDPQFVVVAADTQSGRLAITVTADPGPNQTAYPGVLDLSAPGPLHLMRLPATLRCVQMKLRVEIESTSPVTVQRIGIEGTVTAQYNQLAYGTGDVSAPDGYLA